MPVEAARVRQAGHTRGQRELAELQLGVAAVAALEPGAHVRPGGGTNQRIVKRCRVTFEDDTVAARVADLDLRPVFGGAPRMSRQHQFRAQLVEFEAEDLPKVDSAAALQHHVAADLQFQAAQRGLEREPASVHRNGERKD